MNRTKEVHMQSTQGDAVTFGPGVRFLFRKVDQAVSVHMPYTPGVSSNAVNVIAADGGTDDRALMTGLRSPRNLASLIASLFDLDFHFVSEDADKIVYEFVARPS